MAQTDDLADEESIIGSVVAGRYEVARLVASGGFSRVYEAEQLGIGRRVAIKFLAPRALGHASAIERMERRFMREARILSQLKDPRTIVLYDYGSTDDDRLFMAFEYIEGDDLTNLVRRHGPVEPERVRRILIQVLHSLREAHSLGILHRDIKPSNIMIFDRLGVQDLIKVLDFGIAKSVVAEGAPDTQVTIEGAILGTPRFMSPEQLLGRPLSAASDLFSVGLVGYYLLVGRSPHTSQYLTLLQQQVLQQTFTLPESLPVPDDLRKAVNRMLERSAASRPQSTEEALALLGADSLETLSGERRLTSGPVAFPLDLDSTGLTPPGDLTGELRQVNATRVVEPTVRSPSAPSLDESPQPRVSPRNSPRRSGLLLLLLVGLVSAIASAVWLFYPDEDRSDDQPVVVVDTEEVVEPVRDITPAIEGASYRVGIATRLGLTESRVEARESETQKPAPKPRPRPRPRPREKPPSDPPSDFEVTPLDSPTEK